VRGTHRTSLPAEGAADWGAFAGRGGHTRGKREEGRLVASHAGAGKGEKKWEGGGSGVGVRVGEGEETRGGAAVDSAGGATLSE
jgi:hypothetical protein